MRAALSVLFLLGIALPSGGAPAPWDREFASDVKGILESAKAAPAPADQSVVILLDEQRFSIDRQGRATSTFRKLYRILSQDAVDGWASIEHEYQPWFENRPELRARVITADGAAHTLDPATVAEAPARQFESNVFSDKRILTAPLPAAAKDSVVEYVITVREKAPMLEAGVVRRITVLDTLPLLRFHLVIEADPAIRLRTATRLIADADLKRETVNGRTRIECDLRSLPLRKDLETSLPPDAANYPWVAFSTGESCQAIATAYASIVDRQLAAAGYGALLEGVDLTGAPAAVAARLVARLHSHIRYTGVEFGEAAIVPNTPAETLKRKYGDCKDKSALLTGMLRAAGLKASLALLESGYGSDIDAELPGMGMFTHAIVHVASNPPLWIDATADQMRVGVIPAEVQGRFALIAAPATTALVRVPETPASENWRRHTIDVRMSEYGPGRFVEEMQLSGVGEAALRTVYAERKKAREALESYVKNNYLGKLDKFEMTAPDDFSGPFLLRVEAAQAVRSTTGFDDAGVAIFPHLIFDELPWELTRPESSETDAKKPPQPRRNDFHVASPYRYEVLYRIHPPPGYRLSSTLENIDTQLGPATYRRTVTTSADGVIEAVYFFDSGKRRLTPAEFNALRDGLRKHHQRSVQLLTLAPETTELIAAGLLSQAVGKSAEVVKAAPDSMMAHARFARVLLAAGMGGAARREARKAVEMAPKSALAWQVLAVALMHDTFGRRLRGDWSHAEAEKALRKARELDPDDALAATEMAIFLEHDAFGFRYTKAARMTEAIALYRELLKKQPNPALENNLAIALLYAGSQEETSEQLQKCTPDLQATLKTVLVALKEGAPRAIIAAQTSYPDPNQRALHLFNSALTLIHLRRYDLASTIMSAAARLSSSSDLQTRADMATRFKRYEDALLPPSDPRSIAQRFMLEGFRTNFDVARLKPLITSREKWDDKDHHLKPPGDLGSLRSQFASTGLTNDNLLDLIYSMMTLEKSGDDEHGYRITLNAPGAKTSSLYVVREEGEYRMIGAGSNGLEHVGSLILELLGKKDLAAAQWWLDKVVADFDASEEGTGFPAARALWSGVKGDQRNAAAATLAAHGLIGASKGAAGSIQALEAARLKAPNTTEKAQIDKALCESLARARKWKEMLPVAKRLAASKTFPEEGFRYALRAAREAGDWKEYEAIARQRLIAAPRNSVALRSLAIARIRQRDFAGAAEWTKKLLAWDLAGFDEFLFEAWVSMLTGKDQAAVLVKLQERAKNHVPTRTSQLTIAALMTYAGKLDDARQTLARAVEKEDVDGLDATVWVVYGRIAAAYGLQEEAASAFERARRSKRDTDEAQWALMLLP
jgi:tetratricopeptide (TPR) repeat protein/transglutaminase-like putative cysteine protease